MVVGHNRCGSFDSLTKGQICHLWRHATGLPSSSLPSSTIVEFYQTANVLLHLGSLHVPASPCNIHHPQLNHVRVSRQVLVLQMIYELNLTWVSDVCMLSLSISYRTQGAHRAEAKDAERSLHHWVTQAMSTRRDTRSLEDTDLALHSVATAAGVLMTDAMFHPRLQASAGTSSRLPRYSSGCDALLRLELPLHGFACCLTVSCCAVAAGTVSEPVIVSQLQTLATVREALLLVANTIRGRCGIIAFRQRIVKPEPPLAQYCHHGFIQGTKMPLEMSDNCRNLQLISDFTYRWTLIARSVTFHTRCRLRGILCVTSHSTQS
ncbi:hypothetical protein BDV96DRAFT_89246 [Lophiotrema nucula]|uniref:Uncharacterized protein n=1 Tax=Lophiotrema nucula TaxID=690887 RepID=A0A6A5Z6J6_9PLEO|nr:hypothetical protein BDV96DRAFT_89246 [Lophiotrema nucula]